jgi:hypothetical protein
MSESPAPEPQPNCLVVQDIIALDNPAGNFDATLHKLVQDTRVCDTCPENGKCVVQQNKDVQNIVGFARMREWAEYMIALESPPQAEQEIQSCKIMYPWQRYLMHKYADNTSGTSKSPWEAI